MKQGLIAILTRFAEDGGMRALLWAALFAGPWALGVLCGSHWSSPTVFDGLVFAAVLLGHYVRQKSSSLGGGEVAAAALRRIFAWFGRLLLMVLPAGIAMLAGTVGLGGLDGRNSFYDPTTTIGIVGTSLFISAPVYSAAFFIAGAFELREWRYLGCSFGLLTGFVLSESFAPLVEAHDLGGAFAVSAGPALTSLVFAVIGEKSGQEIGSRPRFFNSITW